MFALSAVPVRYIRILQMLYPVTQTQTFLRIFFFFFKLSKYHTVTGYMRKCNFTYVQYVGEIRNPLRWSGRNKSSEHHHGLFYPHRTITAKRTDKRAFTTITKGRFAAQSFAIQLRDNFCVNIPYTELLSKIEHIQNTDLFHLHP